jgi:hypothetical protein
MAKRLALIAIATSVLAIPSLSLAQEYDYSRGYNPDTQCQQSVNNSRLGGGVVGAGVGAIAGSNIAGHNNRKEGAALGAILGAVVGSQIGRDRVACDDRYQSQGRRTQYENRPSVEYGTRTYGNNGYNNGGYANGGYDQGQYGNNGYDNGYNNGQYGNNGYNNGQYDNSGYNNHQYGNRYPMSRARYDAPRQYSHQSNCGWGSATYRLPNGQVSTDSVWMCRQHDGAWVITSQ